MDLDEISSSSSSPPTLTPPPPPIHHHHHHPHSRRRRRHNQYEEQKRRDWASFVRFLSTRQPRLTPSRVRSSHVIEFLDSSLGGGKTLVHTRACPYFGRSHPPAPCPCPRRHSWGSLDALVGRLRAACQDCSAPPETNPFGLRAVRDYLLRVKDEQATARGIPYSRKRQRTTAAAAAEDEDHGGSAGTPYCSTTAAAAAAEEEDRSGAQPEDPPPPPPPPPPIANNNDDDRSAPGIDPLATGSIGEDLAAQMQFCWVRPPVSEGHSTPPFYPIWRYPTLESLAKKMTLDVLNQIYMIRASKYVKFFHMDSSKRKIIDGMNFQGTFDVAVSMTESQYQKLLASYG